MSTLEYYLTREGHLVKELVCASGNTLLLDFLNRLETDLSKFLHGSFSLDFNFDSSGFGFQVCDTTPEFKITLAFLAKHGYSFHVSYELYNGKRSVRNVKVYNKFMHVSQLDESH